MDMTNSGAMTHQGSGYGTEEYASGAPVRRYEQEEVAASVRQVIEEQIKQEEATRELAPDAYRLSTLSDDTITGHYRKGKEHMGQGDLLDYFRETRQKRIRQVDFSAEVPTVAGENAVREVEPQEESTAPAENTQQRSGFIDLPRSWFDTSSDKPEKGTKTFALSSFAIIATLAVSLMLLVSGTVMDRRGEKLISDMNQDISEAYTQLSDLQAGRESGEDLVLLRQIATEEYGMVEEEHLRMQYISLSKDDSIEAYTEDREEGISLSTLLSAIGISFGD